MLEFLNFRFIDNYVYADMFEDNNYVGVFGAEVYQIEYTSDLKNEIFNRFRELYLSKFIIKGKYNHLTLIK